MTLSEIWKWLSFSIIPYFISRIFYNQYVHQRILEKRHRDNFSEKKLRRADFLHHLFFILSLPLSLLMYPVNRYAFRILYSQYVQDINSVFLVAADNRLDREQQKQEIYNLRIPLHESSEPINLPDFWFDS